MDFSFCFILCIICRKIHSLKIKIYFYLFNVRLVGTIRMLEWKKEIYLHIKNYKKSYQNISFFNCTFLYVSHEFILEPSCMQSSISSCNGIPVSELYIYSNFFLHKIVKNYAPYYFTKPIIQCYYY